MKRVKPFIALIMVFLLLCSCQKPQTDGNQDNSNNPSNPQNSSLSLQLLYCSNDTINPFNTISKINSEIADLLYEPLIRLTDDFEPVYALAQEVTIEGTVCNVKLGSALFSDQTAVTADDVINSYNLAKSSSRYSHLFYEVTRAFAKDNSTVVFELSCHDPYFTNLLTFPIIKKGTENLKDADNVEILPTGSGKYILDKNNELLVANEFYYGEKPKVKTIKLIDAPDTESVEHYVEIGATDLYYTDPVNDNIIRMSGKKRSLNMLNLVYIGINHNYSVLSSPELRYALSGAIDREKIANTAFFSNATAATGFFHPSWSKTSGYQSIQTKAQLKIVVENLEKIGYNSTDSEGYRLSSSGRRLSLTLLVNKDNASRLAAANLIKEQFKQAGIQLTVNAVSNEQYFSALKGGNFQLYLGEVKLTPNMDLSSLVLSGGSAAYGIKAVESNNPDQNTEDPTIADSVNYSRVVEGYSRGENSVFDLATSLQTAMPVIPVLYRNSLLFYSNNVEEFIN